MTEQEKIDQFNRDVEGVLKGNAPEAGTDSQRLDAARQLAAADFSANSRARAITRTRLLARANRELPVQNKRKEMNTRFSNVLRTLAFGAFLLLIVFGLGWVLSNTTPQLGVGLDATPTAEPVIVPEEPAIAFPRQPANWDSMEALMNGRLVLVNGCLRIEDPLTNTNSLLIWPHDYNWQITEGIVEVLDGTGQVVARVGEEISIGGGEAASLAGLGNHTSQTGEALQNEIPAICSGPYWIVAIDGLHKPPLTNNLFRSEANHLEVTVPDGWAAYEGEEYIANPFTGVAAFNSWGETGFWVKEKATQTQNGQSFTYNPNVVLEQIPQDGAYIVLVWQSGGPAIVEPGALGSEEAGIDLSGLWQPGDCREHTGQYLDFYKFERILRLEIYCGPQASEGTVEAVNSLLSSWKFVDERFEQLKQLADLWDASLLESKPVWVYLVHSGHLLQFPETYGNDLIPKPNPNIMEYYYYVDNDLRILKAVTFLKDKDENVVETKVLQDETWFNLTLGTSEGVTTQVHFRSFGSQFVSRVENFLANGGSLEVQEITDESGRLYLVFTATLETQIYEATFDPSTGQLTNMNIYQLSDGGEKVLESKESNLEESFSEPPAEILALLEQTSNDQSFTPLSLDSNSETIRQRILLSHTFWQALWADAQITDYVSGTPAVQRVQVWLNQPAQARVLSGKADGTPATLWISDGQMTRTGEDLSGYGLENFVPPMTESDTVYPHPMTGIMPTPLSSLLFPSGLAQRGGTYRPIAIESVAGRETLVVEWNRPDGPLTDRFWVDTVTGVILHQQNYGKGGDGALTYEYLITHLQYDLTFQPETFNRLASFPPAFATGPEDIFTEVATPVPQGEPDTSLASGEIYLRLEKSYMTEPLGFWRFPASCLVSGLPCPPLEAVPGTPQDSPIQYTWSPDYTQLIYKMEDAGVRNWRFDRLTQTWTLLDIPDLWAEIWSPDSQWLLGVPPGQPENYPLMLTRTDGTEWQTFMDGSSEIKNPIAWLDDHRILMTTTLDNETSEESPTLAKDLQIYDLQTGEIQTLLSKVWNPDTTFYGAFALSPDRTKVVYSIADLNGQNSEIRILTLADNTEFSFTFPAPAGPHWSPTGEWLSLTTAEGYSCGIHLIRPDGSDPHLVFTGDQSGACQHIWSPDGQYILVPAQPQISTIPRFYVINVATGESRLVELPDVGVEFEWPVVSWVP